MSAGARSNSDNSSIRLPGRAKAAGSASHNAFLTSYGHAAAGPARSSHIGLKPGMVTATSKPDRTVSSSCPSTTHSVAKQVSSRTQQASVAASASRHAGAVISSTSPLRTGTPSPDDSSRRGRSSSTSRIRAGFDAVAAQQHQKTLVQPKQRQKVPMFEPLTVPEKTAKPHHVKTSASSLTGKLSPGSSSKAVHPSHTAPVAAGNGLCGIGSPTNNGFLSSLERRKQSTAAAAEASAAGAVAVPAATSATAVIDTSSFTSAALERLKALSCNSRTVSRRASSSGVQPGVGIAVDSSNSSSNPASSRSDDLLNQHTQRSQSYLSAATSVKRSSGRSAVAASSKDIHASSVIAQTGKASVSPPYQQHTTTAAAADAAQDASPTETLLLRNREELVQRLPGSTAAVITRGLAAEVVQLSRSMSLGAVSRSAAAATVAAASSRESFAVQDEHQQAHGTDSNSSASYQHGRVAQGSRAPRQACTGEAERLGAAAAAVAAHQPVVSVLNRQPSQRVAHQLDSALCLNSAHPAAAAAAAVAAAGIGCGYRRQSDTAVVDKAYQQQYSRPYQPQPQPQQQQTQIYNPLYYTSVTDSCIHKQQTSIVSRRSHAGGLNVANSGTGAMSSTRATAAGGGGAASCAYTKPCNSPDSAAGLHTTTAKAAAVATHSANSGTVASRTFSGTSPFSSQQHQQLHTSVSTVRSPSSDVAVSATRQPSFLISTRPLSEELDETCIHPAASPAAAAVAGISAAAAASSAAAGGYVCDSTIAAVDAQDKMAFLTANFSSMGDSFTEPTAGAKLLQQQQQQQQRGSSCSQQQQSASTWDDLGVIGLGQRGTSVYADVQQSPQRRLTAVHSSRARAAAGTDSDTDSDISEMSSSLEQPDSSSSDDSDSEEYSNRLAAAAQRRLVGHKVTLGSSVSIGSLEGRSSSCGSGTELEGVCTLGRQKLHNNSAAAVTARSGHQLPQGCVGLGNLGNTCFMNSILQCLNCLPELVVALLGRGMQQQQQLQLTTAVSSLQWHSKASVGPALSDLFREFWLPQQQQRVRVVSTVRLLRAVAAADGRWGDGCQQDSQEFLHSMLELLQSECNRVLVKPLYKELSGKGTEAQQAAEAEAYARSWHDSMVDDLFGGLLQSTIICSNCNHQSHCFDPFLDLSVPIPRAKQVSLQDCLSAFVEQEVLTGSEQVKCSSCRKTCDATKRLQIYRCPKLLVMTLKRFSNSSRCGVGGFGTSWLGSFSSLSKNQTPVKLDAQRVLDLTPYCNPTGLAATAPVAKNASSKGTANQQPLYELVAVSEHSGCLGGGHYTAHGRSVADGCWYSFNDSCVMPAGHPCGASSSAYVLFLRMLSQDESN